MALSVPTPTAAELKTRYPEFSVVDDARVTIFIEEALSRVNECWREDDQRPAVMALTSHMMALEGEPTASISSGVSNPSTVSGNGLFLKRRKVGDTENEWAESSASANSDSSNASQDEYRSTVYGQKFLKLMKLNFTGVRVI